MMNRPEFLRGWLLLTAQPWGRSYRSDPTSTSSEPSPAKIQAELYYKALAYAYPPAWQEVAELLAAGEKWPSITECKEALRHAKARPTVPVIAAQEHGYITKEEFGLSLYRAVECVGGIIFLQDQYNHAVHVEDQRLQGQVLGKKKKAVKELTEALDALTPQEMTELLQRYPFVASL